MKRQHLFLLLAIVTALAVACGGAPPEPAEFTIEMTEYAFRPDLIEVQVGQEVTINLVNKGQLLHEIMFGRQVMSMEGRPSGYSEDMFETAGFEPVVEMSAEIDEHMAEHMDEHDEMHSGFMVVLPEGDVEATMKFTVTEDMIGEWEMGCFEQDGVHYDAGMIGRFVVTR